MSFGYLLLGVAIAAEVTATSLLPRTHGFTVALPTVAVLIGYAVSFYLLSQVVRTIPVGVAYAIWSGVGTLAVVAIGATLLHQSMTAWQLGGVAFVVLGVGLINLAGR